MSEAPAGSSSATLPAPGVRLGPVALGLTVFGGLLASHGLYEIVLGGPDHVWEGLRHDRRTYSTAFVVALLIAFLLSARAALRQATLHDLEVLRPRLRCTAGEYRALIADFASPPRKPALLAGLAAIPVGLLVIPDSQSGGPFLLSRTPWSHGLVWALLLNATLFGVLGLLVQETFAQMRVFARLEARLGEIDLLDPEPLRLFARRGLRVAALWLVGSALASLIFVNIAYHWATGAVILGTLGVGTLAFLLPMRGLHRRLKSARRTELAEVRARIAAERVGLLQGGGVAPRLATLLAYEARIERVREWPFDAPTLVRFLLLALLATGSWLGGAVVERLLGSLLD